MSAPPGAPGRRALDADAIVAEVVSDGPERKTVGDLLGEARRRIEPRLDPGQARKAASHGALLVDLRSQDDRRREGVIPGSLHIPRSVLEWRVDPDSGHANPHIGGLDRQLVVFCVEGYASSLAAATLRELGYANATDLIGGFTAWRAAGLPVCVLADDSGSDPAEPAGMGGPESDSTAPEPAPT